MMNIVIPMAGAGSRFVQAGYLKPKPFIDVCGKMMIERVLDNLKMDGCRFIIIARAERLASENDSLETLRARYNCHVLSTAKLTEGAACTIMLSSRMINNEDPLMLANSDQIVEADLNRFIGDCNARGLDGSI